MKKIPAVIMTALMTAVFSVIPVSDARADNPVCLTAYAASAESPDNIRYAVLSEGKIRLIWDNVNNADGYVVYKLNLSDGKWVRVKSVKNNYLTISNIKSNARYFYKVAALTKKSDGKYYRGSFSDFIEIKLGIYDNKAPDLSVQNDYFSQFYKNNISRTKYKGNKVKTKAYIAPADVNGNEVMLVNYSYESGDTQIYLYGFADGKVTSGVLIADSTERNSSDAYFVKDEKNGEFYIFSENNYKNSYEFRISRVQNGGIYPVYRANILGNAICYINDEVADYGIYENLRKRYIPYEESDFEADESGEVFYLKNGR